MLSKHVNKDRNVNSGLSLIDLSEFKEEGIEHLNVYMISLKIKMLLVFKTGNQKATEATNR